MVSFLGYYSMTILNIGNTSITSFNICLLETKKASFDCSSWTSFGQPMKNQNVEGFFNKSGPDLNTWGNLHAEFEVEIQQNKGYYKKL